MRKFFLLIPTLVLSLFTNAAVININTGTPDALRVALYTANDGDEIVMAAGTYVESNSNFIAFDGKNVLVRAKEGAEVIIQPQVPITVANGGCAHFQNVKIDASHLNDIESWYEHIIYAQDAAANNRIILDGCEIYNFALNKSLISCPSASALDALTINNCYFHNINKSCVFIENTSNAIAINITNSTFANITTESGYSAGVIDTRATSGSFLVDHCTFYNVEAMNTDYAAIGKVKLASGAVVSNCIFALSTPGASTNRTIRDVVAANNCLVYNYSTDGGYGMQSNVTKSGCFIADPLFADAANGDFSLAGNWVTMSFSPARGAATDGSDLGDPRWYSAEILPEVDFNPSYVFLGEKALLSGSFALNGDNYIQSQNTTTAGLAIWKIQAERKCVVEVTLNIAAANTSGHRYEVALFDSNDNQIGTALAEPSNSWSAGDKVLGSFEIPEAGNYTIKLTNDCNYSSTIIEGVTFTYTGGAVQAMPGTTNINDAWFSAEGTRADGKIDFPDGSIQDGWVKWNVAFANAGNYNVIVNIDNANGHNYTVALYEDENDNSPIIVSEGSQKSTIGTLELGKMEVPAGNYILKVTNAVQWSDAKLISVKFEYKGGGIVTIPGSIDLNEAILSERAYVDADGLHFADADHLWLVPEQWAKWNIQATSGMYSFKFDVASTNYGKYVITLSDAQDNVVYTHEYDHEGDGSYTTEGILLMNGNYILEMQNLQAHSQGYITSIVATSEDNVLILDDNATDAAYINAVDGEDMKVVLNRTFTGGMYNTICLPFTDWMSSVKAIFGDDVKLLELSTAELDGNTLNLIFTTPTELGHGRPYLIKPAQDVKNPIWNGRTINASTGYNTKSCANADFIGSFIAGEVPAGEDNLFLGPENLLYFYDAATPIKGTRAYFHIKGVPHPSQSIKHAKIITNAQVVTSIDFTKGENNKVMKAIENGQLIIIRNGERFTVQGQRIQ